MGRPRTRPARDESGRNMTRRNGDETQRRAERRRLLTPSQRRGSKYFKLLPWRSRWNPLLSAAIEDISKEQSCSGLGAPILVYYGSVPE